MVGCALVEADHCLSKQQWGLMVPTPGLLFEVIVQVDAVFDGCELLQ